MNYKKSMAVLLSASVLASGFSAPGFAADGSRDLLISQIAGKAEKMVSKDMDEDFNFYTKWW